MHQFDEHHTEFKGFSAFYAAEILPALEMQETARLVVVEKIKKAVPIIGGLTITALAIAIYLRAPFMAYAIITGAGVVVGTGGAQHMLREVKSGTKNNIVGGVCRFLGWTFTEDIEEPANFEYFTYLDLIKTNFTRSSFEDLIAGEAHGAGFQFYEAHLERREGSGKNRKWVTKFRGQLLALQFDQDFLGTDQVEARYLLTPTFMQRLVDLEHSVDGKNIRFGFIGGQLLIAIETENRYEPGSMFKPLIETARTQKILDEIGAIYDVIDGVKAR